VVRRGTRQTVAYFDQLRAQLDPEAPHTEVISPGSDFVEIAGHRTPIIGYLGDFLFSPQRARSPVKSLSGGERNRLLLARLFARPANVLVLDEPTNDLDIETLDLLEDLLAQYDGTVFLVSHDRAFLDNVVTQVIAAEGNGNWKEYAGGYEDWLRVRPVPEVIKPTAVPKQVQTKKEEPKPQVAKPAKLSWKEQRELEALPDLIARLEAEQVTLQAKLNDPAIYRDAPQDALQFNTRLQALESEIDASMVRWELLEARAAGK